MNKTGLAGQSIEHSLLPALHNAAYQALGLDWQYQLYPCQTDEDFKALVAAAKRDGSGFIGLDVAAPFRNRVMSVSSGHSQDVPLVQAANTLTFNAGRSRAYSAVYADNTDGKSIVAALQKADVELKGQNVVVYGSDAVALSLMLELARVEVGSLTVLGDNPQEALAQVQTMFRGLGRQRYDSVGRSMKSGNRSEIVRWSSNMDSIVRQLLPKTEVTALPYDQVAEALDNAAVLAITAVSEMGECKAPPISAAMTHPGLIVLDVADCHGQSCLHGAADIENALVIDGLSVLVEQTALSIELWLNAQGYQMEVSREAMRDVLA
jgi:shikimate dehydrogenase